MKDNMICRRMRRIVLRCTTLHCVSSACHNPAALLPCCPLSLPPPPAAGCFNRHYAEHSGYFTKTSFLQDVAVAGGGETTYYDSVPLFIAPRGRTFEQFLSESREHGTHTLSLSLSHTHTWSQSLRGGSSFCLAGGSVLLPPSCLL